MRSILAMLALAAALVAATAADAATKLAVFDFQLANLAQLPPTKADRDRLPHLSDMLRKLLSESGRYEVVPLTGKVKDEVAKASELRSCGGCAVDYAKQLGADVAVTAQIQKVSNLILNMTVFFRDVNGDKPETAHSVSIRGDTDDSFDHGVRYLVKNEILKK